ncbi:MAG TPA: hypothetical protein VG105_15765, partial [Paraburkholderia sp.]|nr:hypothetical protein [Paraburkholderia sp.]
LSLLSKACFAWVILYVVLSIRSALWIGSRHGGKVFLLEFQSRRARGKRESARARWLKAMGIGAALAMPVGIVAFVASLVGPGASIRPGPQTPVALPQKWKTRCVDFPQLSAVFRSYPAGSPVP